MTACYATVAGLVICALALPACDGEGADEPADAGPDAPIDLAAVGTRYAEVLPCRESHDHDLRHVRIFADEGARPLYERCVLPNVPCDEPFPTGATFVKYEYELAGCKDEALVSITASIRLDAASDPMGRTWRWLRLDPDGSIVEDGAPVRCLSCHVNHCAPPTGAGHELRCTPD